MLTSPDDGPYVALFLSEDEPRRTPMEPGGQGRHFVYVTNRNRCTYLFAPRAIDGAFLEALDRAFPMGYAQLYVLEKVHAASSPRGARGQRYCAFQDPARTLVGQGATISFHASAHEAAVAASAHRRSSSIETIVARVVDEMSWH